MFAVQLYVEFELCDCSFVNSEFVFRTVYDTVCNDTECACSMTMSMRYIISHTRFPIHRMPDTCMWIHGDHISIHE